MSSCTGGCCEKSCKCWNRLVFFSQENSTKSFLTNPSSLKQLNFRLKPSKDQPMGERLSQLLGVEQRIHHGYSYHLQSMSCRSNSLVACCQHPIQLEEKVPFAPPAHVITWWIYSHCNVFERTSREFRLWVRATWALVKYRAQWLQCHLGINFFSLRISLHKEIISKCFLKHNIMVH